ncbi:hypothetical protein FQZ97_1163880 [compost metagenome]
MQQVVQAGVDAAHLVRMVVAQKVVEPAQGIGQVVGAARVDQIDLLARVQVVEGQRALGRGPHMAGQCQQRRGGHGAKALAQKATTRSREKVSGVHLDSERLDRGRASSAACSRAS